MSFTNDERVQVDGEKIKQFRKEKGLSQHAVAIRTEWSRSAISDWENGETDPRWSAVKQIAGVLDVAPEDLLLPGRKLWR